MNAHGLFAQHRLATAQGKQHVGQVAGVGSGDQHGIDFGRPAQLLGRSKRQRDIVLPCGIARLLQSASRQPGDATVLRQREPRHQPLDRVQSKPENAKANQENHVARAPSPAAVEVDFGPDLTGSVPSIKDIVRGTSSRRTRAARAGRPRHTVSAIIYFAKTIDAGAELIVAATVLLGSPPPSGLMVNLVMFFDV